MSNEDTKLFSEEEISRMAREIGRPLPGNLEKRIMDKVHARAIELSKTQGVTPTPSSEAAKKRAKAKKRDRGMER